MLRIILLFFLFSPFICLAQKNNKTVFGKIVNTNLEPIEGASIKLITDDTLKLVIEFTFSDKEGKFFMELPKLNTKILLQVSVVGYTTKTVDINDTAVDKLKQVVLSPQTTDLPEVHVFGERGISKRGDTTSFRVTAFAKGNEDNISDLLKKLPGFKIDESGSLSFNGKNISAVLVEDDDLFGRNYNRLINNASINGIEKIEVIENYKNYEKLENSLINNKQTVINLKYKKIGVKNFGELKAGYSPIHRVAELKLSNTSLTKSIKGITIGNKNQIGNLTYKNFGIYNDNSLPNNNVMDKPTSIDHISTPLGFNNIQPININTNRIFDNNSSAFSTNLLIRPIKKVIFKNNYTFINDTYFQNYNNVVTYLNNVIPVVLHQAYSLGKKVNTFNTDGELSINWKPNNQTRISYSISNNINRQLSNGFFQDSSVAQSVENKNALASIALTHTTVITPKSYINIKYIFQKSSSKGLFIFNNPLEDSILKITKSTSEIQQNLTFIQATHFIGVNWFKKFKIFDFSVNYQNTVKNFSPSSYAFGSTNNTISPLPDSFFSRQQVYYDENTIDFGFIKEIRQSLKVDLTYKIKYLKYRLNFMSSRSSDKNLFFLPSISINWRLAKSQSIGVSGNIIAEIPKLNQLYSASVFTSYNTINSNTNIVNARKGFEVELSYNWYDPTEKKIMLNVISGYKSTPNIYNNNFSARGLYAFNTLMPFNDNNNNLFVSVNIEKNLVALKSWLKLRVLSSISTSSTNTQGVLTYNKSSFIESEIRFSTNWSKWLNINTALLNSTNKYKSVIGNLSNNTFSSYDWLLNTTLEFKLSNKLFLDIQYDYLSNNSYNQPRQTVRFLDAKLRYVINSKWNTSLLFRNILNNNSFTTSNTGYSQNIVQNFNLLPVIGLFSIGYKF